MFSCKLSKVLQIVSIKKTLERHIFCRTLSNTSSVIQNNRITIQGYPINYTIVGNGPEVVFCLPGILGTTKIHTVSQIEYFNKDKFTYVTWDQPGYSKSTPPERVPTDFSLLEDAEIMVKFMNILGYKNYSVMGWSGGGCSALLAAINYPEIIKKLVVWGAFSYVDEEDSDIFKSYTNKDNQKGKMMEILVEEYGQEFFSKHFSAWMHLFSRIYTHHSGELCSKKLSDIQCPTLILHGTQDSLVKLKHAEFLKEHIKDSRLVKWKGGKHNIQLRYPEEFNRIVQNFLNNEVDTNSFSKAESN